MPTPVTDWASYTARLDKWLVNQGAWKRLIALLNSDRPMWALVRDDARYRCEVVRGTVTEHVLDCTSNQLHVIWSDSTASTPHQRFFTLRLDDLDAAPVFATEAEAHMACALVLGGYTVHAALPKEREALYSQMCDSMVQALGALPGDAVAPPAPAPPDPVPPPAPKPPPFRAGDEVWYVRVRPARNTPEYDMSHRPRKLKLTYIDDKPRRSDVWGRFVRLQSPGGTMTVSDIVGTEIVRKPKLDHAIFRTEAEALTAVMRYVEPEEKTLAVVCKRRRQKLTEAEVRHATLSRIRKDVSERLPKSTADQR